MNVQKNNKVGMVQNDYKLGDSLNVVVTHNCFQAPRSEIGWWKLQPQNEIQFSWELRYQQQLKWYL